MGSEGNVHVHVVGLCGEWVEGGHEGQCSRA